MASETFGAVAFDVLWDDPFTTPQPDRQNTLVIRRAPWGNRTVVQDLGRDAVEMSYRAELTTAAYAAIDALRAAGTLATLDVGDDDPHSGTLLKSITGRSVDVINDLVTATLTFLVP